MIKTISAITFLLFALLALPFSTFAYSYGYDYYNDYNAVYSSGYSYSNSYSPQYNYSNNGDCLYGGLAGALTCTLGSNGGGLVGVYASGNYNYGYGQISGPQYSYSQGHTIHQTGGIAGALMQGFY